MTEPAANVTEDQATLDLIETVQKKKQEIKSLEHPRYQTTMTFSYTENRQSDSVNLHVASAPETLLKIAGFLTAQAQGYHSAAHAFKIEAPPFQWQTFTAEQWMADIAMRINVINLADKRKKLDALERRLDAIISPELRRKLELEAIRKEME